MIFEFMIMGIGIISVCYIWTKWYFDGLFEKVDDLNE